MIEAKLPDGTVLRFPDGTADSVIDRVVRERMGLAAPASPSAPATPAVAPRAASPAAPAAPPRAAIPGQGLPPGVDANALGGPPANAGALSALLTPEGQSARRRALWDEAQASLPEGYELVATFPDNGRIYRTPEGTMGAVSAGGATIDRETVETLMQGGTFADAWQQDIDRERIAANPIAARGNEVIRGVPFVGSWTDDAVGLVSPQAGETMRRTSEAMARENPYETMGYNVLGGVLGAIPMAMAAGGAIARAPTTLRGRAGVGSLLGLTEGTIWGAGEGEGAARVENAQERGLLGGLLGGALPFAGAAASRYVNGLLGHRAIRQAAATAPDDATLRAQANETFERAESHQLPMHDFRTAMQPALIQAQRQGMDPALTPDAARVAQRIEQEAAIPEAGIPWREVDTLRTQAGIAAGSAKPQEAMIGSQMVGVLDNFVDRVAPTLGDEVTEARAMWGIMRRNERIQEAFQNARLAPSGFENGLRQEFRRILKSDDLRRGFSAGEVKAMERVVRGTFSNNALRLLGTFGISTDQGRNALGAAVGAAVGGSFGGLPTAALTVAATTGARALSNRSTRQAAEVAAALTRTGGLLSLPQVSNYGRGVLETGLLGAGRAPAERVSPF